MSWNCSCKQVNDDELSACSNCGRKKPKYLGVKIDFGKHELTTEQLSVWYLMISYEYLKTAKETNDQVYEFMNSKGNPPYRDENLNSHFSKLKSNIILNCNNCLKFVEEALKLNPAPQFKDEDDATQDSKSVKSLCYYELGSIEFRSSNYSKAIDYFQNSFSSDPNQISIFQLALSTMKLPVEGGGGLFNGKKTEEATANKKKQEIELLKKTIQFGPFSPIGIKAASVLFENYKILLTESDFKNI